MKGIKKRRVTFDNKGFIINNKRVFICSGELHYFRIPPSQWYDRLLKCKRAFLNSIGSYMAWNWHEQEEGKFCFKRDKDIERWIKLIDELDLYIIARPGPYICAEWDFGGFPNWLIPKDCEMRSLETNFMKYSRKWLKKVNRIIKPHLITTGGNIFLYQVENEFTAGDVPYHLKLMEIVKKDGVDVPITTCENPSVAGTDLHESVNPYLFGSWDISLPINKVKVSIKRQPDKPPFATEIGTTCYTAFGCKLPFGTAWAGGYTPPELEEVYLKSLIYAGLSGFNRYMYHGGTNLGYWPSRGVTTSYDFDAPIREWGELDRRYYIWRRLGGFLESFGNKILESVPCDNLCEVSDKDVKVFSKKGRDFAFLFLGNLYSKYLEFNITLKHPKTGETLSIPSKGRYKLHPYNMTILPVNVNISGSIYLLWSTSEIFYLIDNGREKVLILYGDEGSEGETVFTFKKKPQITGDVTYRWSDGRIFLNYHHSHSPDYITILSGKERLCLILTTHEIASRTWLFKCRRRTIPLVSNLYFLKDWKEENSKVRLNLEVKEGKNTVDIPFWNRPEDIKVDNNKIKFDYKEKQNIMSFKLPDEKMPRLKVDLKGNWRIKSDTFESQPNFDDSGWVKWKPWEPLESYGFLKNGYAWYRKTFELDRVKRPVYLILTCFQDEASVYLNGRYIATGRENLKKDVSGFVKAGKNTLAILMESEGHNCHGQKSFNGITHPVYLSYGEKAITLRDWKRLNPYSLYTEKELMKKIPKETRLDFDDTEWEKIIVDWNWDYRTAKSPDEMSFSWYRTEFNVSEDFISGKMISIDFEPGVIEKVYLYLNGKFIGRRINTGFSPAPSFSFDITGDINPGTRNVIAVGIKAERWTFLFGLYGQVKISTHEYCLDKTWKIKEGLTGQNNLWFRDDYDDSSWKEKKIPEERLSKPGGIIWLRKKVRLVLPDGYIMPLRLTIKGAKSKALIYFNGTLIGRYAEIGPQEDFYIWEDIIKKDNVVTVALVGKNKGAKIDEIFISSYYVAKTTEVKIKLGREKMRI